MAGQRDFQFNPHPVYDMPGFGLDALTKANTAAKEVVAAKTGNFTSASIAHGSNGFEVIGVFANGCTGATVEILNADDADKVLATYALKPLDPVKFFTFFDTHVIVGQTPNVKFRVSGVTGGGSASVAVNIRPTA